VATSTVPATTPVLRHELSPLQSLVLTNNFDAKGPFLFGKDLHPMLDCANLRDQMDFFDD